VSQIASAYALSSAEVSRCAALWAERAYGAFWDRIQHFEIVRGFGYSGAVIVVVFDYLRDKGIALPLNLSADGIRGLAADGGVLSCAAAGEAANACARLSALTAAARELGDYWENWFGERDAVAEEAMRAGIDWLAEVYRVGSGSEWTIVWVG
jgi:hypothetical protein